MTIFKCCIMHSRPHRTKQQTCMTWSSACRKEPVACDMRKCIVSANQRHKIILISGLQGEQQANAHCLHDFTISASLDIKEPISAAEAQPHHGLDQLCCCQNLHNSLLPPCLRTTGLLALLLLLNNLLFWLRIRCDILRSRCVVLAWGVVEVLLPF